MPNCTWPGVLLSFHTPTFPSCGSDLVLFTPSLKTQFSPTLAGLRALHNPCALAHPTRLRDAAFPDNSTSASAAGATDLHSSQVIHSNWASPIPVTFVPAEAPVTRAVQQITCYTHSEEGGAFLCSQNALFKLRETQCCHSLSAEPKMSLTVNQATEASPQIF